MVDKQLKTSCKGAERVEDGGKQKIFFFPAGEPRAYMNDDRNELVGKE